MQIKIHVHFYKITNVKKYKRKQFLCKNNIIRYRFDEFVYLFNNILFYSYKFINVFRFEYFELIM